MYGGEGGDRGGKGGEGTSEYVCFSGSQWVVGGLCVMKGIKLTLLLKNNKIKNILVQLAYGYTCL